MTIRQAAHVVTVALADVCFDDTDMSSEISTLCDEFHNEDMSESLLTSRVRMILENGEFGQWMTDKVCHALIRAIKEY